MICRNICEKIYSKIMVGQPHYSVGKKYCRRCECYFITDKRFCACCGMQLRTTPVETQYKVKMRQNRKKSVPTNQSFSGISFGGFVFPYTEKVYSIWHYRF